jgi:hypothetical protein
VPRENLHDAFQVFAPRSPGVVGRIEFFDEFVAEQFNSIAFC